MSVFDWVSLPKNRLTEAMEKARAKFAPREGYGIFSGRSMSYSKDGQMAETRLRGIPIRASCGQVVSNGGLFFTARSPLLHDKPF